MINPHHTIQKLMVSQPKDSALWATAEEAIDVVEEFERYHKADLRKKIEALPPAEHAGRLNEFEYQEMLWLIRALKRRRSAAA